MIPSLILLFTFVLLGLPAALVCIPWTLLTGQVMPLYQAGNAIARLGLRLAGIRLVVEGLELIPEGKACLFLSNHLSNLDPPILIPLLPGRASVYVKRSLMKIPILGYGMQLAKFVPVDRGGGAEIAQQSMAVGQEALSHGIHIAIFAEGTRSPDGRMLPFKKGPFYLAMASGVPCIPVSIWGTERLMPKGSLKIAPGTAHVRFHAPMYPRNYPTREALLEAVRNSVASGLPAWMRS